MAEIYTISANFFSFAMRDNQLKLAKVEYIRKAATKDPLPQLYTCVVDVSYSVTPFLKMEISWMPAFSLLVSSPLATRRIF